MPPVPDTASPPPAAEPPKSLEGHVVPPERLSMILPHVLVLAGTALAVSNELPLQADAGDFAAVLDRAGE